MADADTRTRAAQAAQNGGSVERAQLSSAIRSVNRLKRIAGSSDLVSRHLLARQMGLMFDGDRDVMKVLGYPTRISVEDMRAKYERQDVAGRIVDLPAESTWQDPPRIVDGGGDDEGRSEFTDAFHRLADRLRLWHYMERVDRISGIGRFGVLLIGVKGSADLTQPLPEDLDASDLIYLSPYAEDHVEIEEWGTDPRSPRFGRPTLYSIQLTDGQDDDGFEPDDDELDVHWSRVLHVAENLEEDDVYGRPRLKRVYNRLHDMLKVAGGSGEMFWQQAAPWAHVDVPPDLDVPPEGEDGSLKDLKEQFQEAIHGLRRTLFTRGAKFNMVGGEEPRPEETFQVQQLLLAAGADIPVRILFGSERGELASSQDQQQWDRKTSTRREKHATYMIRNWADRLISRGTLPRPSGRWRPVWEPLYQPSRQQQAETAASLATAARDLAEARLAGLPLEDDQMLDILGLGPAGVEADDLFRQEEDARAREEIEGVD